MADSSPLEAPLVGSTDGERSRWRRPVLSIAVVASAVVAIVVVGLLLIDPFHVAGVSRAAKPSSDQAPASVSELLKIYPRLASVKQVNELLGRLPAHDVEEVVFQQIRPHMEPLFGSFLQQYGSTAPHFKTGMKTKYRHELGDEDEFKYRLGVFEASLREVVRLNNFEAQHNLRPDRAVFGVTKFADWTPEEFQTLLKPPASKPNATVDTSAKTMQAARRSIKPSFNESEKPKPPCTKNWAAEYPSVFAARNQGACGGCYAFAAVEGIRTMTFLNTGIDPGELSVQSVLDCKGDGCVGGDAGDVMNWVHKRGGIPRKVDYGPYLAEKKKCRLGASMPNIVTTSGAERFYDEEATAKKLCESGPLSMGVYAKPWHHYISGVLSHHSCPKHEVDHDTQVVGVLEDKGAFLIRNSWGKDWGVNATTFEPDMIHGGFILLEYGQNTCHNTDCNSFPKDVTCLGNCSVQYPRPAPSPPADYICSNACPFANDGVCDDGGPGSDGLTCLYGTDCNDCGARPPLSIPIPNCIPFVTC